MNYSFFALMSRMKYIGRWSLMRSAIPENISEHSHMVAVISHALAVIRRDIFKGDCDPGDAAALALFHDSAEIMTGDLPTPVKYHGSELRDAYGKIEALALKKLLSFLPGEMKPAYAGLLGGAGDHELSALVKAADKLSALIKCIEERKAGNSEFLMAERQTRQSLESFNLPEVQYFMENFMPGFELPLDDLGITTFE